MSKKKAENVKEDIPTIVVLTPSTDNLRFADDETGPDHKDDDILVERRGSLRRNSISLPNLDDLEVLKVKVGEIAEENESHCDDESEDEEIPTFRTPLRNARRKSVSSPRMLKPPGDEESGSNSPANSVTSINSLASLLREKIQALPQTIRKKKTPDYKIRIFVGIIFITIVVLIVCAYFLYHQKVLQRAYFEKIKFSKVKKIMKIYNEEGNEIIKGRLATTINTDKVFRCLPENERNDNSICLEWMHNARLYLHHYEINDIKCYNLKWISLSENIHPTDCFDISSNGEHWYGGGQNAENAWPLEKGEHPFAPFITGVVDKHEWGNVLKRYFISSKGVAITIDDESPLYVSVNGKNPKELCLKAKYDNFAYVNRITNTPQLNYSICIGSNITDLDLKLTDGYLEKEDIDNFETILTEPVWDITSSIKNEITEETLQNLSDITSHNNDIFKLGYILINEFWQAEVGDFEFDKKRFPTLEEIFKMLDRRGHKLVLTIQPFISTQSFNFAEAVEKGLLISERHGDRRIPALTRYKSLQSAGVLDVTNNKTLPWLTEKLRSVMDKANFFLLDLGVAYDLPYYYQCQKPLINPDEYKTIFTQSLMNNVKIFGVSSAVEKPPLQSFVLLPPFETSWEGLRRVIPTILTYGIIGYPFILPGAVGGDYVVNSNVSSDTLVDRELYIRWLQLATFLPVMRYKTIPVVYGDKMILNLFKNLTELRKNTVIHVLSKYSKVAISDGQSIIRPLWMLDPNDPACHSVVDQFSIGNDIIVAPILYAGARTREIYLPTGVWKDGITGNIKKGSRWIHDYKVKEEQVAYFEKMPDDTRF